MENIQLNFTKKNPDVKTPSKQTSGAGAYDIHAFIPTSVAISPGEIKSIPTGLFFEVPAGFIASIRPRSGLALKYGITMINSPGTIDSDFRGEVQILMINHGKSVFNINNGDRIAQLVLEKSFSISWNYSQKLTETLRGENGFGSTGK